jgi:hypothetical protein
LGKRTEEREADGGSHSFVGQIGRRQVSRDPDLSGVDAEVDHPGEDGGQTPMSRHRVSKVPEVDPPRQVGRRLLQGVAQLVDVDAPMGERAAYRDESGDAHRRWEPADEVGSDDGSEAVADEDDAACRGNAREDQVEDLRADLRIGRVIARLLEPPVPQCGIEGRFSERDTGTRVVTAETELDRSHALLELATVRARCLADRLLDRQAGQGDLLVPSPQSMRVLRCDDLHSLEVGITELRESLGEVGAPSVLPVAVADAVQEEQDRFVRHSADSIRQCPGPQPLRDSLRQYRPGSRSMLSMGVPFRG